MTTEPSTSPPPLDPLAELILGQSIAGTAVPVLLLAPDEEADSDDPFTTEGYQQQCRRGRERLGSAGGGGRAGSGILALNFHALSPENRDEAEQALRSLADLGESWSPDRSSARQQVFVGFYDGHRETALWGADLCDRLGLSACFFPIFRADLPGEAELQDEDLAALAERHSIGFHTDSHLFVTEIDQGNVEAEVVEPIERIRAATGRAPTIGAWCGGTRFDPGELANRALQQTSVTHLLSNWSIERVPELH